MTRISANLITLDEERHLGACLDSLRWVDEIVIVDGGSRDRTVEIARRYTDRIIVHPFDDFARQRNRALAASRGEWVLSLDADERVPTALAREIAQVTSDDDPMAGYWVPIRSRIFGRRFRFSGTQHEQKMRLFRRQLARWSGAVHEIVSLRGPVGRLRFAIEHHSTPDLATYCRKFARYHHLNSEGGSAVPQPHGQWGSGNRPAASGARSTTATQAALRAAWTFGKLYVGKLGVLDGPEGFCFCALSGWSVWRADRSSGATGARWPRAFELFLPVKEDRHDHAFVVA